MSQSQVEELVRSIDPIGDAGVETWRRSPVAAAIRTRTLIRTQDMSIHVSGRPGRIRVIALVGAALLVLGAGAGTAAILLGEPAPPQVKRDLSGVDAGFPSDLRYNPDVTNARSVAATGTSTLYYAELKDGGHCTEITTGGVPRGAVCTIAAQMQSQPIEVTVPFTDPVTLDSPVTVGGHVNAPGVVSLEIRYEDGASDPITLGDNRFFIFDVPGEHVASVHRAAFAIVGLDASGNDVARADIPAIEEEPVGPIDDNAPITVDTISDGSDFTKVLGVRGEVNAEGAASLEFRYPDGTTIDVPLGKDGSYSFDIPADRQGDLFEAPGTLVARDPDGHEVASMPVASVAFWRAHQALATSRP